MAMLVYQRETIAMFHRHQRFHFIPRQCGQVCATSIAATRLRKGQLFQHGSRIKWEFMWDLSYIYIIWDLSGIYMN